MTTRGMYLLGMLALLFIANVCMLMGMTNWPQRTRENFATTMVASGKHASDKHASGKHASGKMVAEGFMDMLVPAGGSAFGTAAIGSYDGRNLASGLPPAAQGFRARLPDEPLAGPEIEVGPDNLFIFANNQVKPECCGATLSSDGGCVCTTAKQRDFINQRGGNRLHDDGF
jgi:hypothetical protein